MNYSDIQFNKPLFDDLFSKTAEYYAKKVRFSGKNNPTQLRRFYDELIMWNDKVQLARDEQGKSRRDDAYKESSPFIKMLIAKVAYSKGRNHVDETFETMFRHCINQITDAESLKHCKLFMEAFMGFYKAIEK
jgi:CRISPR-associated protein Csm2